MVTKLPGEIQITCVRSRYRSLLGKEPCTSSCVSVFDRQTLLPIIVNILPLRQLQRTRGTAVRLRVRCPPTRDSHKRGRSLQWLCLLSFSEAGDLVNQWRAASRLSGAPDIARHLLLLFDEIQDAPAGAVSCEEIHLRGVHRTPLEDARVST